MTPWSLVEHYQRSEWFYSARHIPEVLRHKRCSAVCTYRMNTCMDCNLRICTCRVLIYVLGWGDSASHMCRAVISLHTLWRNVNGNTTVNNASVLHDRVKPDCRLLVQPLQPGNFSRFSTCDERRLRRFSLLYRVQTVSGHQASSCSLDTGGCFPGSTLTTRVYLVPTLRMSGALPPLLHMPYYILLNYALGQFFPLYGA